MKLSEFRRRIDALDDAKALGSDPEVTVKVYGGGVIGTPSSRVDTVLPGVDIDNWQVVITVEDVIFCRKRRSKRRVP